jgi:uncharacterized protein (TIGR02271 family)
MAKTVVGLFDTTEGAERAVRDLYSRGFSRDDISIVANNASGAYSADTTAVGDGDTTAEGAGAGAVGGSVLGGGLGLLVIPGIGPVAAAGTLAAVLGSTAVGAGIGAAAGGLIGALVGAGVPEEDAQIYAEGVRRGGTLVTVSTTDERADDAVTALEAGDPVNIDERHAELRQSGWDRFDSAAEPYNTNQIDEFRSTSRASVANQTGSVAEGKEAVLPVVEEELLVGKREVQRGRVRVHSHVTETPVEENVRLREERVTVERRPVNRELTAADSEAFQERNFELQETAEEAVVNKQARVVEEVTIDKEVNDRVETVRDTVRRTDVDVQEVGAKSDSSYEGYASDFRTYYNQNLASSGLAYNDYDPAFRYGHSLANDSRYRGQDWATFERQARTDWESRQQGPWDQFKDSIRYAWDKARGRA